MKQILIYTCVLVVGCTNKTPAPTRSEVSGMWKNDDGATLQLNTNGTFDGKLLPVDILVNEYEGKRFDAQGTWTIESNSKSWDQLPWEINLKFTTTKGINYNGTSSLLLSGDNFLENKAPWNYLFTWKDEEGGTRYKFLKAPIK